MMDMGMEGSGEGMMLPNGMAPKLPTTEDNKKYLDELTTDYNRLRRQKSRPSAGIEGRVLLNLCFVHDEQWTEYKQQAIAYEKRDENKLHLMFNFIKPKLKKIMGRLSAMDPPYRAVPDKKDPKAFALAQLSDRMLQSLDTKLGEPSRKAERLYWMAVGGTAFEYVPWIPNQSIEPMPQYSEQGELLYKNTVDDSIVPEGMKEIAIAQGVPEEVFEVYEEPEPVGEVGSEILGPLNVFIDQSVKSIDDLAPDQRVYIAKIRTIGWIQENFEGIEVEKDQDFQIVSTKFNLAGGGESAGGVFLKDLIPMVQGSADDTDPDMCVVVEAYAPRSKKHPRGRYTVFIPGKAILHDADNPYEEIPLVDFHWEPVTTTFWTGDYITSQIAPQRFVNKRMSQLGEQSNSTIYANLLLGGGLKSSDIPADYPGMVENGLGENGEPNVKRLEPPQLPSWFMNSIEMTMQMLGEISGGMDLMAKPQFPGQMRGPQAMPFMQEILDTEWGPLYEHIGERTAKVKQMRLNRVKQFYPPIRSMHYVSRDMKDEVITFHTEKVLKSGVNFNVTVNRGQLIPEFRALKEARVSERLNGPLSILYMDERTGRIDKSKIAADLNFGDTGRESREAQYRKLGAEIVDMLWKGTMPPPVLPFYDHAVMNDELEAAMSTTEFLRASPQLQQLFIARYEQHRQFLMQEAEQQQMMMNQRNVQNAVAMATQQAAAQAAAQAVDEARGMKEANDRQDTGSIVKSAAEREQADMGRRAPKQPTKRKMTIEESGGE